MLESMAKREILHAKTLQIEDGIAIEEVGKSKYLNVKAVESGLSLIEIETWRLRRRIAVCIISCFIIANLVIAAIIIYLSVVDIMFIDSMKITPSDRVVDSELLMILIGATTVQLGAISVSVARWLFPAE